MWLTGVMMPGLAWEGGFEWRDEWIVTSGRFSVLLVYTEYTEYMSWWWTVDSGQGGRRFNEDGQPLFVLEFSGTGAMIVMYSVVVVVFCRGILRRER